MTAPHIVDPAGLLGEALSEASPDLMRSLLQSIINALLSADADAVVGAEWGRPTASRTSQRNGYRHRDLDTRVGTLDVAVPKLRQGSLYPDWLLERRKRAERALTSVVATSAEDAQVSIEPAGSPTTPEDPSGLSMTMIGVMGAAVGLLLGIIAAVATTRPRTELR